MLSREQIVAIDRLLIAGDRHCDVRESAAMTGYWRQAESALTREQIDAIERATIGGTNAFDRANWMRGHGDSDAAVRAMHTALPSLLAMARASLDLAEQRRKWVKALRAEQENTAQRALEMAAAMAGNYKRGRADAVADMAHPCTCGSGAHPRECKRHVWAFEAHIEEMSLEQAAIEGAVHGSVRRLSERVREADELLDSAMRMVGGSWEQELEAYRAKWGTRA